MITQPESGLTTQQYNDILSGTYNSVSYRVEAHDVLPKWSVGQSNTGGTSSTFSLSGTGPYTTCEYNGIVYIKDSATGMWSYNGTSGLLTTLTSPFAGAARLLCNAFGLYAFYIESNLPKWRVSTNGGTSWSVATTISYTPNNLREQHRTTFTVTLRKIIPLRVNPTVNFSTAYVIHGYIPELNIDVIHYSDRDNALNYAGDGTPIFYPYRIKDIVGVNVSTASIGGFAGGDLSYSTIICETEIPGPLSAESTLLDAAVDRYYEQVQALVSFQFHIGALDLRALLNSQSLQLHSVIDQANRYQNGDQISGAGILKIGNSFYANTYRTRGTETNTISHLTDYQSFDGEAWSLGFAHTLPPGATTACDMYLVGSNILAFSKDGKMFITPATLHYGVSNSALTQDITTHVDSISIQRAQGLSASFQLHNDTGAFSPSTALPSVHSAAENKRIAYKLYVRYDTRELLLGTVYHDSLQRQNDSEGRDMLSVTARDEMSLISDYYVSEDFKQIDPARSRATINSSNTSPTAVLSILGTNKLPSFSVIGSKCFPYMELYTSFPVNWVFFQDYNEVTVTQNAVNAPYLFLQARAARVYYCLVSLGDIQNNYYYHYLPNLTGMAASNGRYTAKSCAALQATAKLVIPNGGTDLQAYLASINIQRIDIEMASSGASSKNYIRLYTQYARVKSNDIVYQSTPPPLATIETFNPPIVLKNKGMISTRVQAFAANSTNFTVTPLPISGSTGYVNPVPLYDLWSYDNTVPHTPILRRYTRSTTPTANLAFDVLMMSLTGISYLQSIITDNATTRVENLFYAFPIVTFTANNGKKYECQPSNAGGIIQQPAGNNSVNQLFGGTHYCYIPEELRGKVKTITLDVFYTNFRISITKATGATVYTTGANVNIATAFLSLFTLNDATFTQGVRVPANYGSLKGAKIGDSPHHVFWGYFKTENKSYMMATRNPSDLNDNNISPRFITPSLDTHLQVASIVDIPSYYNAAYARAVGFLYKSSNDQRLTLPSRLIDQESGSTSIEANLAAKLGEEDQLYFLTTGSGSLVNKVIGYLKAGFEKLEDIQMEYITLDPGEAVMGGLQRAIDGRYIKMFTRFDGSIVPYQWVNKASSYTFTDPYEFNVSTDTREIYSHVRMLGAYKEAEVIDAALLSIIGYRFTEINNPYLVSEEECAAEAQNAFRRMKESARITSYAHDFVPFLEPEDRVTTDEGDHIIDDWQLDFDNGGVIANYSLRKWVV